MSEISSSYVGIYNTMRAEYLTLNVACGYVLFLLTFVIISKSSFFACEDLAVDHESDRHTT